MTSSFTVLHHASLVAPLGFRFWDAVNATAVRDGLHVQVTRKGVPLQTYPTFPNASGIYVVRGLPKLRAFEHGLLPNGKQASDVQAFWDAWKAIQLPLVVTVTDPQERFLPIQFEAQAPNQGVFNLGCLVSSPLSPLSPIEDGLPNVPLFSAPGRQLPATCAAIFAELRVIDSPVAPEPEHAAWAWVEAHHRGKLLARGMSDRDGRVALFFAYPEVNMLELNVFHSPIGSAVPLDAQTWQIDITAGYTRLVRDAKGNLPAPAKLPDLCAVMKQPAISNPTRVTLHYGQPLVVRSAGSTRPLSVWQIAPS
jgi:hypothetical protein